MNLYEIIEVSPKASVEVIKNAYKTLAKKYHPDSCTCDKKIGENKMKDLNDAYSILSDPIKRFNYDKAHNINIKNPSKDSSNINSEQKQSQTDSEKNTSRSQNSTYKNEQATYNRNYYRSRYTSYNDYVKKKHEKESNSSTSDKKYSSINSMNIINRYTKKSKLLFTSILFILIIAIISTFYKINTNYVNAQVFFEKGEYNKSVETFNKIVIYKDSRLMLTKSKYFLAKELIKKNDFLKALIILKEIIPFEDSQKIYEGNKDKLYIQSVEMMKENKYTSALTNFIFLDGYLDCLEKLNLCKYSIGNKLFDDAKYSEALSYYLEIKNYNDSDIKSNLCKYKLLKRDENGLICKSPSNIISKRAILNNLTLKSNNEGSIIEKECYNAVTSAFFDDVKLFSEWVMTTGGKEHGSIRLEQNEKGELALSIPFKKTQEGTYYRAVIKNINNSEKTVIQYGDDIKGWVDNFRIEGFDKKDSASPQKLYLYSYYYDKLYTLEK